LYFGLPIIARPLIVTLLGLINIIKATFPRRSRTKCYVGCAAVPVVGGMYHYGTRCHEAAVDATCDTYAHAELIVHCGANIG
jgi:hypothetical protein